MKIKRDKIDEIFSKLIREANDWTCECCGRQVAEDRRQSLHASHYMSRRHAATRFHPDNVFAHCFGCHQKLGGDPSEFYRWYCKTNGEGLEEIIRDMAMAVFKRSKPDKEDLYKHYKAEYKRIMEARSNGAIGKLEIVSYD